MRNLFKLDDATRVLLVIRPSSRLIGVQAMNTHASHLADSRCGTRVPSRTTMESPMANVFPLVAHKIGLISYTSGFLGGFSRILTPCLSFDLTFTLSSFDVAKLGLHHSVNQWNFYASKFIWNSTVFLLSIIDEHLSFFILVFSIQFSSIDLQ